MTSVTGYRQQAYRSAKLATGFVFGTIALFGLAWLLNLLFIAPDATTEADRRLAPQILYPTAALLTVAIAWAVFRSPTVGVPRTPRAILATFTGSAINAISIAIVWKFGGTWAVSLDAASGSPSRVYLLSAAPVYVIFASPLLVAALAGRGGRAGAVVVSWTITLLCVAAWLSSAMQTAT